VERKKSKNEIRNDWSKESKKDKQESK